MKILSNSTKIILSCGLAFILVLGVYSIQSLTQTITDSSSTYETYIKTSDGKYFASTNAGLQNAYNSLSNGGKISIPGNTSISITSSISMTTNSDIDIMGDGASSELKLADGGDVDIFTLNGVHNFTISNLKFNVNNFTQDAYVNAISMGASQWTSNITIYNCWFVHGNASFIDAEEYTYNIIVNHCFFDEIEENIYNHAATYNKDKARYPAAIWFSGYDCQATFNYIRDTFACGIVIEAGTNDPTARGHLIEGNDITGRVSHPIHMEGWGSSQGYFKSSTTRIVNNRLYDFNSSAYEQTDPGYGRGILVRENSTCIGNYIRNAPDHAIVSGGNYTIISDNIIDTTGDHAIRTSGDNYTIIITNNDIQNTGGNAIHLDSSYGYLAIVTGNIIKNTTGDAINCGSKKLIAKNNYIEDTGDVALIVSISTAENITFSDNIIDNCDGTYAIYSPAPIMLKDNWIYDSPSYCIYITDTADNSIISGNHIFGVATNDGIHFRAEKSIICNNILRGNGAIDGIQLHSAFNNTVYWNIITGFTNGVKETDGADYNKIYYNDAEDCTNDVVIAGSNTKVNMTGQDNWNFIS